MVHKIRIFWVGDVNLGSANVRIGLAQQDAPISVPHCIARRTSQVPKKNVQDQVCAFFTWMQSLVVWFWCLFELNSLFVIFFFTICSGSCLILRLQQCSTWSAKGLTILLVKRYLASWFMLIELRMHAGVPAMLCYVSFLCFWTKSFIICWDVCMSWSSDCFVVENTVFRWGSDKQSIFTKGMFLGWDFRTVLELEMP